MLDAFVVRLLRRHVGVCHVAAPQDDVGQFVPSDTSTKALTFTVTQTLLGASEDAPQGRPGPLARVIAPLVERKPVPVLQRLQRWSP